MNLSPEQIGLIAVAAAVLFWPKIAPMLKSFAKKATEASPMADDPSTASRSVVVVELLKLQDAAKRLAKPKAAELIAAAIVEIIGKGTK